MLSIDYINKLKWKKVQVPCLIAWHEASYVGVFELYTGAGKTKTAIEGVCRHIVKSDYKETAIIVVPTTNLRDNEWKDELVKWGYEKCLPCFKFLTRQAALNELCYTDNLIVDELHTILTAEYSNILKLIKYKRFIGLTASLDAPKKAMLKKLKIPIVYSFNYMQALEMGIADKLETFIYEVPLTFEDQQLYDANEVKLKNCSAELASFEDFKEPNVFKKAKYITENANLFEDVKEIVNCAWKYTKCIRTRRTIVYRNVNKIDVLKEFLTVLAQYEDDAQVLVYSEETEVIEAAHKGFLDAGISVTIYHNKLHKDVKKENLKQFTEGNKAVMLSAKALVAGLNIPNVKFEVCLSTDSNSLAATQRHGRVVRPTNQIGRCIYFATKNSVEYSWIYNQNKDKPYSKLTKITNFQDIWHTK